MSSPVNPNTKVFQSSNLQSGSYNPVNGEMTITFVSGSVYHYYNVPVRRWEELRSAVSPGKYLREHIHANYSFKRIPRDEDPTVDTG